MSTNYARESAFNNIVISLKLHLSSRLFRRGSSVPPPNSVSAVPPTPASISRTHNSYASPLFTPATSTAASSAPTIAPHSAVPIVAPSSAVPSLHSAPTHPTGNPFSAESLFQSSKGESAKTRIFRQNVAFRTGYLPLFTCAQMKRTYYAVNWIQDFWLRKNVLWSQRVRLRHRIYVQKCTIINTSIRMFISIPLLCYHLHRRLRYTLRPL